MDDDDVFVQEVNENDVCLGRGSGANDHPGNKRFRKLIFEYHQEYRSSTMRGEKAKIAQRVVAAVHSSNGRFLRKLEPDEEAELVSRHDSRGRGIVSGEQEEEKEDGNSSCHAATKNNSAGRTRLEAEEESESDVNGGDDEDGGAGITDGRSTNDSRFLPPLRRSSSLDASSYFKVITDMNVLRLKTKLAFQHCIRSQNAPAGTRPQRHRNDKEEDDSSAGVDDNHDNTDTNENDGNNDRQHGHDDHREGTAGHNVPSAATATAAGSGGSSPRTKKDKKRKRDGGGRNDIFPFDHTTKNTTSSSSAIGRNEPHDHDLRDHSSGGTIVSERQKLEKQVHHNNIIEQRRKSNSETIDAEAPMTPSASRGRVEHGVASYDHHDGDRKPRSQHSSPQHAAQHPISSRRHDDPQHVTAEQDAMILQRGRRAQQYEDPAPALQHLHDRRTALISHLQQQQQRQRDGHHGGGSQQQRATSDRAPGAAPITAESKQPSPEWRGKGLSASAVSAQLREEGEEKNAPQHDGIDSIIQQHLSQQQLQMRQEQVADELLRRQHGLLQGGEGRGATAASSSSGASSSILDPQQLLARALIGSGRSSQSGIQSSPTTATAIPAPPVPPSEDRLLLAALLQEQQSRRARAEQIRSLLDQSVDQRPFPPSSFSPTTTTQPSWLSQRNIALQRQAILSSLLPNNVSLASSFSASAAATAWNNRTGSLANDNVMTALLEQQQQQFRQRMSGGQELPSSPYRAGGFSASSPSASLLRFSRTREEELLRLLQQQPAAGSRTFFSRGGGLPPMNPMLGADANRATSRAELLAILARQREIELLSSSSVTAASLPRRPLFPDHDTTGAMLERLAAQEQLQEEERRRSQSRQPSAAARPSPPTRQDQQQQEHEHQPHEHIQQQQQQQERLAAARAEIVLNSVAAASSASSSPSSSRNTAAVTGAAAAAMRTTAPSSTIDQGQTSSSAATSSALASMPIMPPPPPTPASTTDARLKDDATLSAPLPLSGRTLQKAKASREDDDGQGSSCGAAAEAVAGTERNKSRSAEDESEDS